MKILDGFKRLNNWVFTKYFATLFAVIIVSSLTLAFVAKKTENSYNSIERVNNQQKEELLQTLQKLGNACTLFSDTELNLDLLENKFLKKFIHNFQITSSENNLLPINPSELDWSFINQYRQKFKKNKVKLNKVIDSQKIWNYFKAKDDWSNLLMILNTLSKQTRDDFKSLGFFFEEIIFNDQSKKEFFHFLNKNLSFFQSKSFTNYLNNLQKWVLNINYVMFFLKFASSFKIDSYKNHVQDKKLNILLNFLLLAQNLNLEKQLKEFLKENFNHEKISDVFNDLKSNSPLQQRIKNRLNQLNKKDRIDLEIRKKIFEIVTKNFVDKFVQKSLFSLKKPSALLTSNLNNLGEFKSIFTSFLQKKEFTSFFQLTNLLFFDYLITEQENIPKDFSGFLDSFINFGQDLDFQATPFGYIAEALVEHLKVLFSKDIQFNSQDVKSLRQDLLHWINDIKIFKNNDSIKIDHDNNYQTKMKSLAEIKEELKEEDTAVNLRTTKEEISQIFTSLLNMTPFYLLIKNNFRVDKDNLVFSQIQKTLFSFLKEIKTNFFIKNLNQLKFLKFLTPNWKLTDLKLEEKFNEEKQKEAEKLKNEIQKATKSFSDLNKPEENNLPKKLKNFFKAIYEWIDFLWINLLVYLPFLDLNALFILILKFILPNYDLTQKAVLFGNFGKKEVIYAFFVKFLKFFILFWEALDNENLVTNWNRDPDKDGQIKIQDENNLFKKMITNLGFKKTSIDYKKDDLFTKDSFFDKFFQSLQSNSKSSTNDKNFVFFFQKKIIGENGFIIFFLDQLDQYLSQNFYSYLNPNNWNYKNIKFVNLDEFFNQENNKPLQISYSASLRKTTSLKIQYHLSWQISIEKNLPKIKLVSFEKDVVGV